ncbi:MAG: 2-amino-4-hydroxy-6-hydroxymethyldihydropteridine diphosphokinase [Myxococcota bacterium]
MASKAHTTAYLGLGSNMGDRARFLRAAIQRIGDVEATRVVRVSDLYETEPRLFHEQPDFVNACAEIVTALDAESLLDELLEIERELGRVRTTNNGPRPIDLDILFYGDAVIDVEGLRVPHPGVPDRGFVLVPLAQIAPDFVHPELGASMRQLCAACEDSGWVKAVDELPAS